MEYRALQAVIRRKKKLSRQKIKQLSPGEATLADVLSDACDLDVRAGYSRYKTVRWPKGARLKRVGVAGKVCYLPRLKGVQLDDHSSVALRG